MRSRVDMVNRSWRLVKSTRTLQPSFSLVFFFLFLFLFYNCNDKNRSKSFIKKENKNSVMRLMTDEHKTVYGMTIRLCPTTSRIPFFCCCFHGPTFPILHLTFLLPMWNLLITLNLALHSIFIPLVFHRHIGSWIWYGL